jgi:Inner membrane component of T3SS, cytoplasmic domain
MATPKTELSIRCDGEALAPIILEPGEYTVGSAPGCEVRIERPGIADRHVLLTVNYDEIFVEPLEGTEVRVNDRPISGYTRLWPHQRVQVGSAILEAHRQKSGPGTDESLPPSAIQIQRLIPPELHRDRRYRHSPGTRPGRHGCGAPGPRSGAAPLGRDEGAARSARFGASSSFRRRGLGHRPARAPLHPSGARARRG